MNKKLEFADGHGLKESVEGSHSRKAFVREMGNIIDHNKTVNAKRRVLMQR
jgi:hypothetical protein